MGEERTYLTAEQLKERWNFKEVRQIYSLARSKKIPATKIGGSWRFPLDLLLEYEATHTSIPEELKIKKATS